MLEKHHVHTIVDSEGFVHVGVLCMYHSETF